MKNQSKSVSVLLKAVAGTAFALALAGCSGINGEIDDVYHPGAFYEQSPVHRDQGHGEDAGAVPDRAHQFSP